MLGVMLADTLLSKIWPRVNWLIVVENTGTTPAAVVTQARAPCFRSSFLAMPAGTATSVAPVSNKKVTGLPLIVPVDT